MSEILRRGNPFLDKFHRLDHEGVQHTIDGEAGDILYADRGLADFAHRADCGLDGRFRRVEAGITSTSFMRETGEK